MWRYAGLRDEAIYAYPGILIYAVILGSRKLSVTIWLFMIVNLITIGYVNSEGIYINSTSSSSLQSGILLAIILILIGFSVWFLSSDLRKLLEKLTKENERVRKSQVQIKELLHHDALTNLPNRIMAKDRFQQALARAKRESSMVCMMFLDLDNFKNINDSLGHSSGDKYLKLLSVRLVELLRETDCVCRLGGDEFLIILESISDKIEVLTLAEKILENVKLPINIGGNSISVTCSIGIAITPDDGHSFEMISRNADMAMYQAKDAGRNNYRFYNQQMNIDAKDSITLIADLHKALPDNQLYLLYQPKLDIRSKQVVGAEALLRWKHPQKGLIPPNKFIPVAESSGLIIDIGSWVIEQACKDCKYWTEKGLEDIDVAVNVSSIQFKRGNITSVVLQALEKAGLGGHLLELEMTESLLIDQSGELKMTLSELRDAGIRFSIDDFGTGYSNLAYLKNFEVETLKIDQSFIRRVQQSPQDMALVKAIVQMSSSLNMKTVAEGIETKEVMDICEQLSCDIGQGYYWAKPLPLDEFIEFTKQHSA